MNQKAFPLEPIEKASIDELRSLQLKRLQQTLQHAYANSPVYRAKFDAAGVHPDDCKTLADIAKFPFTTKSDLRDSYPHHGQAHGGGLHPQRHRHLGQRRGPKHPCRWCQTR